MFYEHVHMNFKGNYLLARTICGQVQEILPERVKHNTQVENGNENVQNNSFHSEQEVARYLAYTDWEKKSIAEKVVNEFLKQPPFINQLYNKARSQAKKSSRSEFLTPLWQKSRWMKLNSNISGRFVKHLRMPSYIGNMV